jgi:2-polyprenyl-3-methyl-5-hydroxy-6-metoxy-1,4-benzoquinol methylase
MIKNKFEKWLQKERYLKVAPFLKGKILDFGCGDMTKDKLERVVGKSVDYTGVDKNDIISGMFDAIISCAVFEHVESPSAAINKLDNHLNPHGAIVITTPSTGSKIVQDFLVLTHLFHKENIEGHRYLSKEDLAALGNMVYYNKFQFGMNQIAVFKKDEG